MSREFLLKFQSGIFTEHLRNDEENCIFLFRNGVWRSCTAWKMLSGRKTRLRCNRGQGPGHPTAPDSPPLGQIQSDAEHPPASRRTLPTDQPPRSWSPRARITAILAPQFKFRAIQIPDSGSLIQIPKSESLISSKFRMPWEFPNSIKFLNPRKFSNKFWPKLSGKFANF